MPAPKGHPPYNKNGEGGRPTKYTKEFIENEADEFEKWINNTKSIWHEDFAMMRNYSPRLLCLWAKQNERFSEVYEKVQLWQKSLLITGGLLSKYNCGITKLVLSNTIGWTDKQETKLSGDSTSPLAFVLQDVEGSTKDLVDEDE